MQISIEGSPAVPKSSMRKIRPLQNKSFKWIKGIQIPSHPFDGIPWVKKLPKFFNLASDLFFCGLINTQTLDIIVNKIKNHSNVLKKGSIHRKSRSDLNEIDLQILAGIGLIGVITFKVSNMYSIIMYAENWIQNWGREEVVALAILKSYLNKT